MKLLVLALFLTSCIPLNRPSEYGCYVAPPVCPTPKECKVNEPYDLEIRLNLCEIENQRVQDESDFWRKRYIDFECPANLLLE